MELKRKINLYGLTMIAVGSCIGAGIFATPGGVVAAAPHQGYVMLVWIVGGIIALTGALTFAELGGMFPKAGGVYVFLKEAYGPIAGFFYGWITLFVINTGSIAALALTLAEYLTAFFPLSSSGKLLLAILVVVALTGVNILGVQLSQLLSNVFTGLKLIAILAIVALGFVFFDPVQNPVQLNLAQNAPANLGPALLLALIGALWSYGGWHHASYMAGETVNPQKTVPRAMVLGALVVVATYVLVNASYMMLLPLDQIGVSNKVAADAVETAVVGGGKWVAVAIVLSVFGTIGIYTMSAPRIYYAMAGDQVFFKQLAAVHPKYGTPANAMILQSAWAILLLLFWGRFSDLITYVTFMDILFMTLAAIGLFVFRQQRPQANRPYKVWGYPFVPAIFVGISGLFVLSTLVQKPVQALAGLALLFPGILGYWYFKSVRK